jgi:glycosyltransferase involved in cell wall biosynthesis
MRNIPKNCTVLPMNTKVDALVKFKSLRGLFSQLFWGELFFVKRKLHKSISRKTIFTILISLYNAQQIERFLNRTIQHPSSHIFYSYWAMDSAIGLAILKLKNPSFITISRCHGWDVYFEASSINYIPFRKLINDKLDRIFAISERGKHYAQTHWKINFPAKICVSKLGVEAANGNSTLKYRDKFTIVTCSNVIPLKRLDLIVKTLNTLNNVPIRWVHFGDGIQLNEIKKMAQNCTTDFIDIVFKGRVRNVEVLDWYEKNHVDLFMNVSSSEGIPVSIMEAMSAGIPVAASDVGGNSEIVTNSNGWLLDANPSIESIRYVITECMALPEETYTKKSRAAYHTWETQYNASKNFPVFAQSIKEL